MGVTFRNSHIQDLKALGENLHNPGRNFTNVRILS